jgi:hypothetical protein
MTPELVAERLALLRRPLWLKETLGAWLGINFPRAEPLLAQFRMATQMSYDAAFETDTTIDRSRFAIFLSTRGWTPARAAALEFALTDRCFSRVIEAARERNFASPSEAEGVFPGVYSSDFISNFFKRFPTLRTTTFPNTDVFFVRLHQQIRDHLKVAPEPLMCLTSDVLEDKHYANCLDAITEEPMSLPFQVFLDTGKPGQLRPDTCSWLTYFRFETILRPALLGRAPSATETQIARLRAYDNPG